jgi:hypothetical protein
MGERSISGKTIFIMEDQLTLNLGGYIQYIPIIWVNKRIINKFLGILGGRP